MVTSNRVHNSEIEAVESVLRTTFPSAEAYRYNSASIRIRIVDERFAGKSLVERESMVLPLIQSLPEDTQMDITVLLLLTRDEMERSMMNYEFEDPTPSEF